MNFNAKISAVAKALDLTSRRIQQLVKDGILPTPVKGNYDLSACIRAYEKYMHERQITKSSKHSDLTAEKLRLLRAQADKAEFEMQVLEGKYIAVNEIDQIWSGLVIAFRTKMLALPNNVARQLMTLENDFNAIVKLLQDEIHQALTELSNYRSE